MERTRERLHYSTYLEHILSIPSYRVYSKSALDRMRDNWEDFELRITGKKRYTPKSLKELVSFAKSFSGNNILQQLVLDSCIPNKCSENYISSVLYSISDCAVHTPNKDGFLPLHMAVQLMNFAMVEKLLSHLGRADVNGKHARNEQTALHFAAEIECGQGMINLLLSKGADIEARDIRGKTPLFYAVSRGNMENVKLLVEKGADVNAKDLGDVTPLVVVNRKAVEMALFLLNKGAHVRDFERENSFSPLFNFF